MQETTTPAEAPAFEIIYRYPAGDLTVLHGKRLDPKLQEHERSVLSVQVPTAELDGMDDRQIQNLFREQHPA